MGGERWGWTVGKKEGGVLGCWKCAAKQIADSVFLQANEGTLVKLPNKR